MRDLFASENRCIQNILRENGATDALHNLETPQVVGESYAEQRVPSKGGQFNVDFLFSFVERRRIGSVRRTIMSEVLPNAIGAELFLVLEGESDIPVQLHLLAGEAFPRRYFRRYIDAVETRIAQLVADVPRDRAASPASRLVATNDNAAKMLRDSRIRDAAYARLLVLGGEVCFLFFPRCQAPRVAGERHSLCDEGGARIDCYIEGSEIHCFDGWIPVEVTHSEWKLEAKWNGPAAP